MKHLATYINEVSSELMQRAAEKQRARLEDDDFLDRISGRELKKLKARADEFEKYGKELKQKEKETTKWQLDDEERFWHNWEIIYTVDINSSDGFKGYYEDSWCKTNLSKVTKLYVSKSTHERYGGGYHYWIYFDCNGKYGGGGAHLVVEDFFKNLSSKKWTFNDYTKAYDLYKFVISDMEDEGENNKVKWLGETDFVDIVNNFDDSNMGNKSGSLRCTAKQLYNLLLIKQCYAGTQAKKRIWLKKGKDYANPYYADGTDIDLDEVSDLLNCDKNTRSCTDKADRININNIKEINITDIKHARNKKFFRTYLADAAFLYLIDIILDNNIRRYEEPERTWAGNYITTEYIINTVDQLTYEDLEDWMKTFGLTKDKVHIKSKKVWVDIDDFPDAG